MTHIATWDALCHLLGRCNFVSGADCKLAVQESMDHIDRRGGRFVSTLLASHKGGCVLRLGSSPTRPLGRRRCTGPGDCAPVLTTSTGPRSTVALDGRLPAGESTVLGQGRA